MTRRQKAIGFFITLCVLLVGAAILLNIYWIVITSFKTQSNYFLTNPFAPPTEPTLSLLALQVFHEGGFGFFRPGGQPPSAVTVAFIDWYRFRWPVRAAIARKALDATHPKRTNLGVSGARSRDLSAFSRARARLIGHLLEQPLVRGAVGWVEPVVVVRVDVDVDVGDGQARAVADGLPLWRGRGGHRGRAGP